MTTTTPADRSSSLTLARSVLKTEAHAVLALAERLGETFLRALDLLSTCRGRVIVTGMGKSGIIARKIASTLSSTGTSAYFLHPAEALHGDLGVIQRDDLVVALSHSGETPELLRLLETLKRLGPSIIAVTGTPGSTLASAVDVSLDCHVDSEACPLNLAPTASTTAALALGDALAMTLLVHKGFHEEDFANLHPGGHLGKRLLRISRVMHGGASVPSVMLDASLSEIVRAISEKGLGMVCVTNADGRLSGVITDGDLRRRLADPAGLASSVAADLMTVSPLTIAESALAVQALDMMEDHRVTSLVVIDGVRQIRGVVHLHDLWKTELF